MWARRPRCPSEASCPQPSRRECRSCRRATPPWAAARPEPDAAGGCCTTSHHKTHSTGSGDEVVVSYAWHPWAGRAVRFHEVIERATGTAARCSLADAPIARPQEIPVWMLDPVACRTMRAAAQPVAALSVLMSLHALLADAAGGEDRVPTRARLASPESPGDRHATASAPTAPVGPATRTRFDEQTVDPDAAGLERPAGGDAADPHPSSDPPAGRARPRGRSAGERPSRRQRR